MQRCLNALSLLLLLAIFGKTGSLAATTAAPQVVEGVGAIIQRNQAAARQHAVQDALRKALEQTVAELLDPLIVVQNLQVLETHLYARTLTYVQSYRVLWEYPDTSQKVYRVGLETNIATADVARSIETLGFAPSGEAQRGLLILIVEHRLGLPPPSPGQGTDGVVADGLRAQLSAQGFHVVPLAPAVLWDGQENSALLAARKSGANVLLLGRAAVEKIRSEVAGMPLQALQATAQVQALAAKTGQRLALERAQTIAFHADTILGGKQALEKAATELAARFAPFLRTYQQQFLQQGESPLGGDNTTHLPLPQ